MSKNDISSFLSSLNISKEDEDNYRNLFAKAKLTNEELLKSTLKDFIAIGVPYFPAKKMDEFVKSMSVGQLNCLISSF